MEILVQFWYKWEIQLLVLLSFMLQLFLFFNGILRQYSSNAVLRLSLWTAYLGADSVAIYALGFLSRQDHTAIEKVKLSGNHPLAFFWAPFLLIHLGGQDTITAFAIEDNNLWLRHLLNMVVQVMLALYVFWNSTGWRNMQLLAPGIFVFIVGIIKYAERILALMYGNLSSIGDSISGENENSVLPEINRGDSYAGIVCFALRSVPIVRGLFAGRATYQNPMLTFGQDWFYTDGKFDEGQVLKLLEIELGLMYDDMYTKAMVLRTWGGITLRCVSLVSMVVSLVLFLVSNKQPYSGADVAITYTLFAGGFLLEVCAVFTMAVVSPWTWSWLEARKWRWLADVSWRLLRSDIGRPEKKPLWSNTMGQYSFLDYLGCERPTGLSGRLMKIIRKMASVVIRTGGPRKLFWVSKLLETRSVEVDKEIMECFAKAFELAEYDLLERRPRSEDQHWPHLGPMLQGMLSKFSLNFGHFVVFLHVFTEVHLSKASPAATGMGAAETGALVGACRKLSNYMLYLLVTHPSSMLAVSTSAEATLEFCCGKIMEEHAVMRGGSGKDDILRAASNVQDRYEFPEPQQCKEALLEIRDVWVRLIVYIACKSRPEMHAAQLGRGGELLTFVWLLMAHKNLGESAYRRIQLTNALLGDHSAPYIQLYALHFPED